MPATKPHKTSQRKGLSTEQHNAIDLLVLGHPDQAVSEQIGVTRETVCRWRNENPYFQAELHKRRKALWEAAHDKLQALVSKALDTLENALEDGDVRAAVEVLKTIQLYGNVSAPEGETDPELVLLEQAEVWASQEIRRQDPSDDPLADFIVFDGACARLTRQRLEALRQTYLA